MDASILDLRYKMRDVLKALNNREKVRILYHGKVKGEIIPLKGDQSTKTINHLIFGCRKNAKESPEKIVSKIRTGRYHDL